VLGFRQDWEAYMRAGMGNCVKILFGAWLLVASLSGCASSYDSYMKLGRGPEGGSYSCEGNVTRWAGPEAMVEASYLSPANTDLYFSLFKGGRYKNPFPPGTCVVFSLLVENRGGSAITYDPRMTRLYPEGGQPVTVRDFSSLYVELDMAGAGGLDERMKIFKETCFDVAVTLSPGEKIQRLLVYPRCKDCGDKAALVIEGLYAGHTPRAVPLVFGGLSAD
jgi:hypothetical protein